MKGSRIILVDWRYLRAVNGSMSSLGDVAPPLKSRSWKRKGEGKHRKQGGDSLLSQEKEGEAEAAVNIGSVMNSRQSLIIILKTELGRFHQCRSLLRPQAHFAILMRACQRYLNEIRIRSMVSQHFRPPKLSRKETNID